MNHRDNTIPDAVWRGLSKRTVVAAFGTAECVRRVRLAGLHYRASKRGWN